MVSPFYESHVQCNQAIYRPQDNVVVPQQDGPGLVARRIAIFRVWRPGCIYIAATVGVEVTLPDEDIRKFK
jgi:hypothetical protein